MNFRFRIFDFRLQIASDLSRACNPKSAIRNQVRSYNTVVRIRLRRIGSKGQPSYRMIVADVEAPRDGRFLEVVGFYNPRTKPETVQVNEERVLHWLRVGAQPSESATRLLTKYGTLGRFARLQSGEALEVLLAEAAQAAQAAPPIDPKTTSRGEAGTSSKKAKRRLCQRLNNQRPSRPPAHFAPFPLTMGSV
jgi:small subunit ribosomal protein S16